MKNKKALFIALGIIVLIISLGLVWWFMPTTLGNINFDEIDKIEIFDGNTGKTVTLTHENVKSLYSQFKDIKVKKDSISLGRMGTSYRIKMYDKDGKLLNGFNDFIVNAPTAIRKDPFFYVPVDGDKSLSNLYSYLKNLIATQGK